MKSPWTIAGWTLVLLIAVSGAAGLTLLLPGGGGLLGQAGDDGAAKVWCCRQKGGGCGAAPISENTCISGGFFALSYDLSGNANENACITACGGRPSLLPQQPFSPGAPAPDTNPFDVPPGPAAGDPPVQPGSSSSPAALAYGCCFLKGPREKEFVAGELSDPAFAASFEVCSAEPANISFEIKVPLPLYDGRNFPKDANFVSAKSLDMARCERGWTDGGTGGESAPAPYFACCRRGAPDVMITSHAEAIPWDAYTGQRVQIMPNQPSPALNEQYNPVYACARAGNAGITGYWNSRPSRDALKYFSDTCQNSGTSSSSVSSTSVAADQWLYKCSRVAGAPFTCGKFTPATDTQNRITYTTYTSRISQEICDASCFSGRTAAEACKDNSCVKGSAEELAAGGDLLFLQREDGSIGCRSFIERGGKC